MKKLPVQKLALLTLLAPITSLPVWAETLAAETLSPEALSAEIVTIRNKPELAQWFPGSVTVVTNKDTSPTNKNSLSDLQGLVPGLIVNAQNQSAQAASMGLRGLQSSHTGKSFAPAVAVLVDGDYVGTHTAQDQLLHDFSRVEVNRMPAGTFLGVPAEAGSINIILNKPQHELTFDTAFSMTDPAEGDAEFVLNVPLMEGLATRLGGKLLRENNGGSLQNGKTIRNDRWMLRFSVLYDQFENSEIQYTFETEQDDSDVPISLNFSSVDDLVCVPDPVNNPGVRANCQQGPTTAEHGSDLDFSLQNFGSNQNFDVDTHRLNVETAISGFSVVAKLSYRNSTERADQDLDATSANVFSSTRHQDYDQSSFELRASSEWGDQLDYQFGFSQLEMDYQAERTDDFLLDTLNSAGRFGTAIQPGQSRFVRSSQDASYRSIFAHGNYQANDQWQLDAGVRLNRHRIRYGQFIGAINSLATPPMPQLATEIADEETFNEVVGLLGFNFKVDEKAIAYGRYTSAVTPGGFSDAALSAGSARSFDSSSSQMFELGIKSDWLEDRLRLNVAIFNSYRDDIVEPVFLRVASSATIEPSHSNVASMKVNGIDLEFEYLPPIDNLLIKGAWSHIRARNSRFVVPSLDTTGDSIDLQVQPLLAPDDSIYLAGFYEYPFFSGKLQFNANYRYFTEYRSNAFVEVGRVESRTQWDLSLAFEWDQYRLAVFSQNVNNKVVRIDAQRYLDADFIPVSTTLVAPQGIVTTTGRSEPRLVGIKFSWFPSIKAGSDGNL